VGIVGALIGSTVQHFYSLAQSLDARQAEAYIAFMNAFDKSRTAESEKKAGRKKAAEDLEQQYKLEAGAAVRRIAVFGHKQVVEAIAKWYRRDAILPCEDDMSIEIATWKAMRESSLGKRQEVNSSDFAAAAGRCTLEVRQ